MDDRDMGVVPVPADTALDPRFGRVGAGPDGTRHAHWGLDQRPRRRDVGQVAGGIAKVPTLLPEADGRLRVHGIEPALTRLPSEPRCVLLLVSVRGMAREDAARALGCTTGTVESRLNRARNHLADLLRLDQDDGGGNRSGRH
ncbi:MAG: sigma factor-like helix-turn-helix DNA-binding protein [Microvirga sp.]